ncbi:MAG: OmpA family protein, partial [Stellaceae bacterium]
IHTAEFPSNWELSSARAQSVVRYLITQVIPPNRLVAAGFGQYTPITTGTTDADYRQNRRIELKLTER